MRLSYITEIRRRLHECPEIGFDLPKTLDIVRDELARLDISYTEKYGKSGIVATINEEKTQFTIGVRADMDALPIQEKNDVSYRSKLDGQMHACGHDAHTAILLDLARRLKEKKDDINCRVKLIFQPAEEYPPGGAKLMAEDGAVDDIDCVVALHCDPNHMCGKVAFSEGDIGAISNGFLLDFYGKSAHVQNQDKGIDAIMMSVKAYTAIEMMLAKEIHPRAAVLFNVGSIHGGEANNVICDHCRMHCTLRAWSEEADAHVEGRIKRIIAAVAEESGGRAEWTTLKHYPMIHPNQTVNEHLKNAAISVLGEEHITVQPRTFGAEDFSFFAERKPSAIFRLGVRNPDKDCVYGLHQDRFNLDEDALQIGSDIFMAFILQNENGILF